MDYSSDNESDFDFGESQYSLKIDKPDNNEARIQSGTIEKEYKRAREIDKEAKIDFKELDNFLEGIKLKEKETKSTKGRDTKDTIHERGSKRPIQRQASNMTPPNETSYRLRQIRTASSRNRTPVNKKNIKHWYYLLHKGFRQYQFDITQTCLFFNTLVCLPTGLGKTFVAANVIFNYYKWFIEKEQRNHNPKFRNRMQTNGGKIFFLAPTRPLVSQQLQSVRLKMLKNPKILKIKEMDHSLICELTGSYRKSERRIFYQEKSIFFMTPQTLHNDMKHNFVDYQSIVLIIYDEAHRSLGKYAYSEISRIMQKSRTDYRSIALTATPGNNNDNIQEVIDNLCISKIEARAEKDPDVAVYLKHKEYEIVEITRNYQIKLIDAKLKKSISFLLAYLRANFPLKEHQRKIICHNPDDIEIEKIRKLKKFFVKQRGVFINKLGKEKFLRMYLTMKNIEEIDLARDILNEQGEDCFLIYFKEYITSKDKALRRQSQDVLRSQFSSHKRKKVDLEKIPDFVKIDLLESGHLKEIEDAIPYIQSGIHVKLLKLKNILEHFFEANYAKKMNSKVLVFVQRRQTTVELVEYFKKQRKDEKTRIVANEFIGQNKTIVSKNTVLEDKSKEIGMNQSKQKRAIIDLKQSKINTLIATSIAEEGLDIPELDLIICYGSTGLSPVRMIQKFGRTGRMRNGKVILFLTEYEKKGYLNNVQKYTRILANLVNQSNTGKKWNQILFENPEINSSQILDQFDSQSHQKIFKFFCYNSSMLPDGVEMPLLKYVGRTALKSAYDDIEEVRRMENLGSVVSDILKKEEKRDMATLDGYFNKR